MPNTKSRPIADLLDESALSAFNPVDFFLLILIFLFVYTHNIPLAFNLLLSISITFHDVQTIGHLGPRATNLITLQTRISFNDIVILSILVKMVSNK